LENILKKAALKLIGGREHIQEGRTGTLFGYGPRKGGGGNYYQADTLIEEIMVQGGSCVRKKKGTG